MSYLTNLNTKPSGTALKHSVCPVRWGQSPLTDEGLAEILTQGNGSCWKQGSTAYSRGGRQNCPVEPRGQGGTCSSPHTPGSQKEAPQTWQAGRARDRRPGSSDHTGLSRVVSRRARPHLTHHTLNFQKRRGCKYAIMATRSLGPHSFGQL